ncbi:glycerol-3-phosphate acyltransferase 2, mitochondrial isoform X2 [Vombatus ursinus]|uniref:glycerol-3-phosphate acyltransferase 2, mitochondrial isoform X2 n=1 Tax=Vombatus ursinus TaxID=29139 RepID=UPI000FFDAF30|nr:glycerol-3-phosphate acyltransferase 2, mitochondrial isoform X2 [Vombatus ursinus]
MGSKPQSNKEASMWPKGFGVKLETITPFLGKYRPFVGRCCQTCTPKSWEALFHKNIAALGFHNVILVTEENTRYRGWLVRRLCYFLCAMDWKITLTPDAWEKVLGSKWIQEILSGRAPGGAGEGPKPSSLRRDVQHTLGQIQASIYPFLLRIFNWAFLKFLNCIFLNVQLHQGQLAMVRQAAQADTPLIFLSAHKSCLDGLLLPFLLLSQGLGVLRVAWEPQSYSPALRALLRHLGGLFMPPEANLFLDNPKGILSRAVLSAAVEQLLASKQPLLIFLEDRPGAVGPRLSSHGQAWLGLVLQAFREGAIPDAALVPVGIGYDLAPDVQHTGPRASSSHLGLWWGALAVFRGLRGHRGCARIDFAQPFSLQEYSVNTWSRGRSRGQSLEQLLLQTVLGHCVFPSSQTPLGLYCRSVLPDCEKQQEWTPASGPLLALDEEDQLLVSRLSRHVLSASIACSAVMATAVMAALLLHRHREGVFLSRLLENFSWLTEETLLRGFDVGFSGQLQDLVMHGLCLLHGSLSLWLLPQGDVLVLPRAGPTLAQLAYHSAALLPVFLCEAVGGKSCGTGLGRERDQFQGDFPVNILGAALPPPFLSCAVRALLAGRVPPEGPWELQGVELLSQRELHRQTLLLLHLLPQDLLLLQPCQSSYFYCQEVLDRLIQCGLLIAEEAPGTRLTCDSGNWRFGEKMLWRSMEDFSDSDSDYEDGTDSRCFKRQVTHSNCTSSC